MLIHKKSKRERLAQLLRRTCYFGFYVFGCGAYLCFLALVIWVLRAGVAAEVLKVGEALVLAVCGTTLLHGVLSTFVA